MNLKDVFESVVIKKLVDVDLPHHSSHQHEINGVQALRLFFDTSDRVSGTIHWILLKDDEEVIHTIRPYTFYDARQAHPTRTEWRLYYEGDALSRADPGDILILARRHDRTIYGLILQQNSGWLRAAQSLFNIAGINNEFRLIDDHDLVTTDLSFSEQQLLSELGVDYELRIAPGMEEQAAYILEMKGGQFPKTEELAKIIWNEPGVDIQEPDNALLIWLQRETELFYALEKIVVEPRIIRGFTTINEFMDYSLSVQNRRKSRMGFSLQNHLAKLFREHHLIFTGQGQTEHKKRPDFLFPGEKEYHDLRFNGAYLIMLGAKSSCKDRWRQVLSEADRIPEKHLFTLERAISENQTDQMQSEHLTLVIPESYHTTYSTGQRADLWTLKQFIDFAKNRGSG